MNLFYINCVWFLHPYFQDPPSPLWVRPRLSTQGPIPNFRRVRNRHLLFEFHQDWVLRDQARPRPRLSDQEQILGMSGLTIPSLSATKIEYSGTTASCMMAFLLKYLFDLSRRCHFLNKGRKMINSQKRRRNKITWEAEHYDHFHQASGWLHT